MLFHWRDKPNTWGSLLCGEGGSSTGCCPHPSRPPPPPRADHCAIPRKPRSIYRAQSQQGSGRVFLNQKQQPIKLVEMPYEPE